jgi:hypothetical protein
MYLPSSNDISLGLIDTKNICELKDFRIEIRPRRSRIRDGADAVFARHFQNPEKSFFILKVKVFKPH